MKEITELENKYLVLKWDDIRYLYSRMKDNLNEIIDFVQESRKSRGKSKSNNYLVLNLDDEIDLDYLLEKVIGKQKEQKEINYQNYRHEILGKNVGGYLKPHDFTAIGKVSDIAVALVNAILKAKEKK